MRTAKQKPFKRGDTVYLSGVPGLEYAAGVVTAAEADGQVLVKLLSGRTPMPINTAQLIRRAV